MEVYFHNDTPAKVGEKHGPRGPTHFATFHVHDLYQVENHIKYAPLDFPHCVRIEVPDLDREWKKDSDGVFQSLTSGK